MPRPQAFLGARSNVRISERQSHNSGMGVDVAFRSRKDVTIRGSSRMDEAMNWVFDPHSGGVKLSEARKSQVRDRIIDLAERLYAGRCSRVEIKFRQQFCYLAAVVKEDDSEIRQQLCRLRHFDLEKWSIALFTWSNERYEPCIFPTGEWFGTLEECVSLGGSFLSEN